MTEEQPEQEPPGQQQPPAAAGDTAKGKKRKLAVFFCYLGAGYHVRPAVGQPSCASTMWLLQLLLWQRVGSPATCAHTKPLSYVATM